MEQEKEVVYRQLSSFFRKHRSQVMELEILSSIHRTKESVLEDKHNLGITKKALVAAFLVARDRFFANTREPEQATDQDMLEAAQIILFFDPEHLTAANHLKRRLIATRKQADRELLLARVGEELVFLESLLTSPLHRHTKSPTLWNHRFWVLTQSEGVNLPVIDGLSSTAGTQSTILWERELGLVQRAGEKHPRNYYAWNHARKFLATIMHTPYPGYEQVFLDNSLKIVFAWCRQHPSDISGWSFLLYLMYTIRSDEPKNRQIVNDVLRLLLEHGFRNPSIWIFLRTALASRELLSESHRARMFCAIRERLLFDPGQYLEARDEDRDAARSLAARQPRSSSLGREDNEAVNATVEWIKAHWQQQQQS